MPRKTISARGKIIIDLETRDPADDRPAIAIAQGGVVRAIPLSDAARSAWQGIKTMKKYGKDK